MEKDTEIIGYNLQIVKETIIQTEKAKTNIETEPTAQISEETLQHMRELGFLNEEEGILEFSEKFFNFTTKNINRMVNKEEDLQYKIQKLLVKFMKEATEFKRKPFTFTELEIFVHKQIHRKIMYQEFTTSNTCEIFLTFYNKKVTTLTFGKSIYDQKTLNNALDGLILHVTQKFTQDMIKASLII